MQQVTSNDLQSSQKHESEKAALQQRATTLETVVATLQRDLENQQNQGRSLKMQIAQKDQQIQTLEANAEKDRQKIAELEAFYS